MNKKLLAEVQKQINEELFSSYLYLAMSAYCQQQNLKGFANWFFVQAQEEVNHAMGFYNHLIERGEAVELLAIQQPEKEFGTPLAMVKEALKHEQHITRRIHLLHGLATEAKDVATQLLLHWYIKEQIEEESNATDLLQKIEMLEGSKTALYMLDKELSGRTFTPEQIS